MSADIIFIYNFHLVLTHDRTIQKRQNSLQEQQIRMLKEHHSFMKLILSTQHSSKDSLDSMTHCELQSDCEVGLLESCGAQKPKSSLSSMLRNHTKGSSVTTTWCGIGWFHLLNTVTRPRSTKEHKQYLPNGNSLPNAEHTRTEWRFLPAAWLHLKGLALTQTSQYGYWKFKLEPLCVVPDKSSIFWACQHGDLEEVISLVKSQKASIFDISERGLTLLHVRQPSFL